jgi:hypothetical protein
VPRGRLAVLELRTQLADRPVSFCDHVVRVDGLEVELAREQEIVVVELHIALEHGLQRDPHRILDEPRL